VQEEIPIGGGYRLIKRIGQGAFGEVWRAETAGGGFEVAIKIVLQPADQEAARREREGLEVVKLLRHHYLLQTQSYWLLDDHLYIVMELADASLRERYRECRAGGLPGIPQDELLRYFDETAEALDYLHGKHVAHRDIKPENILLLQGHVKVADFGLARLQESRLIRASLAGTPIYMAPEICRGKLGPHSDQYSLAVTFAELRLGRPPFDASDRWEAMMQHVQSDPDLAPLGEAERRVLRKALAKDPDKRYPSCREFARALTRALSPQTPAPRRGGSTLLRLLGLAQASTPPAAPVSTVTPVDDDLNATAPVVPRTPADGFRTYQPNDTGTNSDVISPSHAPTPLAPRQWHGDTLPRPRRRRRVLPWLAAAALVAVGIFLVAKLIPRPALPELVQPVAAELRAGEKKTFPIQIGRGNFAGPVTLVFTDVPADLKMTREIAIPSGREDAEVNVEVPPDARPGERQLHLRLAGSNADLTWTLTVKPLATLPAPCEPLPGDILQVSGKYYYSRVAYSLRDDPAQPVLGASFAGFLPAPIVFRLIPKRSPADPPTFYMMEDPVTNEWFARFAAANPEAVENSKWIYGAKRSNPKGEGLIDMGNQEPRLPVMRATLKEALQFAKWLQGSFGAASVCDLPTTKDYDTAGGRWEKPANFLGEVEEWRKLTAQDQTALRRKLWKNMSPTDRAKFGVDRAARGPMRTDEPTLDVSPLGCQHMVANGSEFTTTFYHPVGGREQIDLEFFQGKPGDDARVELRGKSYLSDEPSLWRLERGASNIATSRDGAVSSYAETSEERLCEITFRVVLRPVETR
jgi:serine/threonine protein kinase